MCKKQLSSRHFSFSSCATRDAASPKPQTLKFTTLNLYSLHPVIPGCTGSLTPNALHYPSPQQHGFPKLPHEECCLSQEGYKGFRVCLEEGRCVIPPRLNLKSYKPLALRHCPDPGKMMGKTTNWVAVKELKLSYYVGETLLFFTIYTHYGNLI